MLIPNFIIVWPNFDLKAPAFEDLAFEDEEPVALCSIAQKLLFCLVCDLLKTLSQYRCVSVLDMPQFNFTGI